MLKIFLTLLITFLFLNYFVYSQDANVAASDSTWDKGMFIGLNFSNTGLSNWAGGGQNAINVSSLLNLHANMKKENSSFQNSLEMAYGMTKLGKFGLRKSDDRLILVSNYGYKAAKSLEYSALLDFRTQFTKGYNYDKIDAITGEYLYISNFMSPGYLNVGLGMSYKPDDYFQLYLSPISNRIIFVLDDTLSAQGAYGVEPGKNIKSELGATMALQYERKVYENINFKSRLTIFAPYEHFTTMVVNSETLMTFKINKYMNASISVEMIYDHNINVTRDNGTIGPALQLKHVLAIGIGYKI
ncbi:MAG: DUF3078 domain-containing protein [Candidatus Kapabacteria bacterium]|nr:DUF3078 domain-containing protein [Candidatus Kapabacteria bacterium]